MRTGRKAGKEVRRPHGPDREEGRSGREDRRGPPTAVPLSPEAIPNRDCQGGPGGDGPGKAPGDGIGHRDGEDGVLTGGGPTTCQGPPEEGPLPDPDHIPERPDYEGAPLHLPSPKGIRAAAAGPEEILPADAHPGRVRGHPAPCAGQALRGTEIAYPGQGEGGMPSFRRFPGHRRGQLSPIQRERAAYRGGVRPVLREAGRLSL